MRTLAMENDSFWPKEHWPAMRFNAGISKGAIGGHGPIRYMVEKYEPDEIIQFRFLRPVGFDGIHKFEINKLEENKTEIMHAIEMNTNGKGTLLWFIGIRYLHNALIEDGLDKLENIFTKNQKRSKWNFWVRFLRKQIGKSNHITRKM